MYSRPQELAHTAKRSQCFETIISINLNILQLCGLTLRYEIWKLYLELLTLMQPKQYYCNYTQDQGTEPNYQHRGKGMNWYEQHEKNEPLTIRHSLHTIVRPRRYQDGAEDIGADSDPFLATKPTALTPSKITHD